MASMAQSSAAMLFRPSQCIPALGRLLTPADDQPGGGPDGWAAVISYREWMEYFHGDPSVLGRHMIVTDHSVTIVGVAPEGFEGVIVAEHPDIYCRWNLPRRSMANRHCITAPALADCLRPLRSRVPALSRAAAELSSIFPSVLDAVMPAHFRHSPIVEKTQLEVSSARTGWSDLRPGSRSPWCSADPGWRSAADLLRESLRALPGTRLGSTAGVCHPRGAWRGTLASHAAALH